MPRSEAAADAAPDAATDAAAEEPAAAGEALAPALLQAAARIATRPSDSVASLRMGRLPQASGTRESVPAAPELVPRTCRSGAGRRLGAASDGTDGVEEGRLAVVGQCRSVRSARPTVVVAESPELAHPAEEQQLVDLLDRPVRSLVGRPQMKAVRLAASVGLRPFMSRSR